MKRLARFATIAVALAAAIAAVKAMRRAEDPLPKPATTRSEPWPPLRPDGAATPDAAPAPNTPDPAAQAPAVSTPAQAAPWIEPIDGQCPDGYPIKAKMRSEIFHSPGQLNYDRTTPDRCYVDAAAAEADGLRAAKR